MNTRSQPPERDRTSPRRRTAPEDSISSIRIEWLETLSRLADESTDPPIDVVDAQHVAELENRTEVVLVDDHAALTEAGNVLLPATRALLDAIVDFEQFGPTQQVLGPDWTGSRIQRFADADLGSLRRDIEDLIFQMESILAHG